jgi:hypothetical protein
VTVADEAYELPPLEDTDYWERFHAVGLNQPDISTRANGSTGYTWIDLTSPEYATPPAPPSIQGILYAGRRHVISGPPESTKTLVAYLLLLHALRQGEGVCILDFEMGPHAAVTLLRELGATDDELAAIHYTEPDGPPNQQDVQRIIGLGVSYALIDAAAGAYDVTGLDDNSRKDAETFAAKWIRPLWQAGVATIVIDHVTKNTDTRGKFTIGSERKTGQADVHLSLESLKPLHRGGTGMVKINVHKDRPGHLPRPTVYLVDLTSDEHHRISWELRAPVALEPATGDFRHTIYQERVSRYMEHNPAHAYSKNELEEGVEGKRDYIRAGLNELIADGYVLATQDGKWLRYTLVRPFAPGSPQVRPGEDATNLAPSPHPLRGGKAKGEANQGDKNTAGGANPEIDVHDPNVQRLLDED